MLESPHLFRHRYDIDDVIARLCAAEASMLDTGAGTFTIEPLPLSYLAQTPQHASFAKLPEETQTEVVRLIETTQNWDDLTPHFQQSPAGHWLRERVKDAALEWLDACDLIPPSMRHVPRQAKAMTTTPRKVEIQ